MGVGEIAKSRALCAEGRDGAGDGGRSWGDKLNVALRLSGDTGVGDWAKRKRFGGGGLDGEDGKSNGARDGAGVAVGEGDKSKMGRDWGSDSSCVASKSKGGRAGMSQYIGGVRLRNIACAPG